MYPITHIVCSVGACSWPNDRDRKMRSLEERIPKAANATETHMQLFLHPNGRSSRFMVQEKLNGVYVLWDGAQMGTKTGRPVDVPPEFHEFLPAAFPLVGELFFGYGHNEFNFAVSVSQNKLPGNQTMQPGATAASKKMYGNMLGWWRSIPHCAASTLCGPTSTSMAGNWIVELPCGPAPQGRNRIASLAGDHAI